MSPTLMNITGIFIIHNVINLQVVLMLAWALCSGFRNGYYNYGKMVGVADSAVRYSDGAIGFFLFVTVTLWIVVLIVIILGVLGLLEKLRIPMKMLVVSICIQKASFYDCVNKWLKHWNQTSQI